MCCFILATCNLQRATMFLPFIKMNGAGNDFVILDARLSDITLSPEQVRKVAARDNAVTHGCDQLIILRPSQKADVFMSIYNADGSEVDACGNATRCVATLLEKELERLPVTIETNVALLKGIVKQPFQDNEFILVDMGKPKFDWHDIPLSMPIADAKQKVKSLTGLEVKPDFVSMGNPHVILFVNFYNSLNELASQNIQEFIEAHEKIKEIGYSLENSSDIFPNKVNVTVAALYLQQDQNNKVHYVIQASVWERGAGHTKACGTAACAMLAAAHARDTNIRSLTVQFYNSGENVSVLMDENGHILLGGPVKIEFTGELKIN